jgi:RND superfamily putative drug exporter
MVLLPAVLELLGRRTWAFPRWLDRRLPQLAIEAQRDRMPARLGEPAPEATS